MTAFDELERQLRAGVRREHGGAARESGTARGGGGCGRLRWRSPRRWSSAAAPWRPPGRSGSGRCTTTTTPVAPDPDRGAGVRAGKAKPLALRVADPAGGPPWTLRVFASSRGGELRPGRPGRPRALRRLRPAGHARAAARVAGRDVEPLQRPGARRLPGRARAAADQGRRRCGRSAALPRPPARGLPADERDAAALRPARTRRAARATRRRGRSHARLDAHEPADRRRLPVRGRPADRAVHRRRQGDPRARQRLPARPPSRDGARAWGRRGDPRGDARRRATRGDVRAPAGGRGARDVRRRPDAARRRQGQVARGAARLGHARSAAARCRATSRSGCASSSRDAGRASS